MEWCVFTLEDVMQKLIAIEQKMEALVSGESANNKKRGGRKKQTTALSAVDQEFANSLKEFIAGMVRNYYGRYKSRPIIDGKTLGEIKRLLKMMPAQKAVHLHQVYLQLDDPWFKTKCHDFTTFMSNLQKVANSLNTGQVQDGINWERVFDDDAGSIHETNEEAQRYIRGPLPTRGEG
jgi:hypothetical protein